MKLIQKIEALGPQDYMSDAQLAVFREWIETELTSLREAQDKSIKGIQEIGVRASDPADSATMTEEQQAHARDSAGRKERIVALSQALATMREGEYGFCQKCGEEIGVKRMAAVPYAKHDVECANTVSLSAKKDYGRIVLA